jgi:hypothetical protein
MYTTSKLAKQADPGPSDLNSLNTEKRGVMLEMEARVDI